MKELIKVLWEAKWALLVPVIILGGIYGGIMTPTEAAAVAALYGLIAGMFLYGELTFKRLGDYLAQAAASSAAIIILIAMATLFGNIMAIESVPESIAAFILSVSNNKIAVLIIINAFLLFVGTFMEALAAIVIAGRDAARRESRSFRRYHGCQFGNRFHYSSCRGEFVCFRHDYRLQAYGFGWCRCSAVDFDDCGIAADNLRSRNLHVFGLMRRRFLFKSIKLKNS